MSALFSYDHTYLLCLKMGKRSRWAWTDELYDGADCTTLPSASVALSSVLPGPVVPGFQNVKLAVISAGGSFELNYTVRDYI